MRVSRLARAAAALALALVALPPESLRAQDDRRAEEDFLVAMGLVRRGLHDEAGRQLVAFLRNHPADRRAPEAHYRLGVCWQEQDRAAAAIASFRACLERAPQAFALRAECRYRLGNLLHAAGEHAPALAQNQALVDEVDGEAEHYLAAAALYAGGECARDLGRDDAALALFGAAATVPGKDADNYRVPALSEAGLALMRLGRPAEAAQRFAQAVATDPRNPAAAECRYLEGEARFRAGDFAAADRAYQQAAAMGGPWADDALLGRAWSSLEQGDADTALARFREVVAQADDAALAAAARLEVGRLLYLDGDAAAALQALAPLVADGGDAKLRLGALELRGLAQLDGGAADAAAASFEAALPLAADADARSRLWHNLGEACAEQQDWRAALAAYEQAQPEARGALAGEVAFGRSLALHKLGELDASIAAAEQLLAQDDNHRLAYHARFAIAENHFAAERYGEADAAYSSLPADHELAAQAAFKRAWCAFLAADPGTAAARFAALAEQGPFAEEALSMVALSWFNAEQDERALDAADRYRARHGEEGTFLARTERVASRVLRRRGELQAAAERIAVAARAEGGSARAAEDLLEQAELAFQQGDFTTAQQRYEPLTGVAAVAGRALEGLAWCAFELGLDDACLLHVAEAIAAPDGAARKASLLELRLAVLHRGARWAEAERTARDFLGEFAGHPRAAEVAFGLGVALARADQPGEARRVLASLAQQLDAIEDPAKVFYEWAWACRRDGDEAAALQGFARVAELSRDVDQRGEAHLHLGLAALGEGLVDQARRHFAEVEGEYRPQALYRAGFSWFEAEDWQQARPLFEQVAALGAEQPLYLEAAFMVGECAAAMQDHEEAAARFATLLAGAPDHERAQRARLRGGRSLVLLSRAADAVAWLEPFLRGDATPTERAEAHLWYGRARAARGEHEQAEAQFRAATELSDGALGAEAQWRIGEVRRANGDLDGAAGAFIKLSILYGHELWVRRGLLGAGQCYADLEQPSKAVTFLKELVERFPDSEEAGTARQLLAAAGKGGR